jgi:chromate transporter
MAEGTAAEVFVAFLRLGLIGFGGPVAHFSLFRREFVERRRWIDDQHFAHLMALCQFLPGPGSSQLGFSLGLLRAGWSGALAAFLAFTLPSALLMLGFAALAPRLAGPLGVAALHGLKLVALCVVAHGLAGMIRALCPDMPRRLLAVAAAAAVLAGAPPWAQLPLVLAGGLAGIALCKAVQPRGDADLRLPLDKAIGMRLLVAFSLLAAGLPLVVQLVDSPMLHYANGFVHAGALSFGGGHVALPLLRNAVVLPGWVSSADFLTGYGAAQAVPGPMFTLAAYLGARLPGGDGGAAGAVICTLSIFAPGLILVAGVLPFWSTLAAHPLIARAIAGIGAVVVGLLGAALYDPVWIAAVHAPADLLIAAAGIGLLALRRAPVPAVVLLCTGASVLLSLS